MFRFSASPSCARFTAFTALYFSATFGHSGPTTPEPSTNELSLAVANATDVQLTWLDKTDNETGFKIERRISGMKDWEALPDAPANTTTFTDTGLKAGTTYIYRINPITAGTPVVSETRITAGVPKIPENLLASAASPTEVFLTWVDRSDSETGFKIERKDADGEYREVGTAKANSNSYLDGGLTTGNQVVYRIKSSNSAGELGDSNEFFATPKLAGNLGTMPGLRGDYYDNSKLSGGPLLNWVEPTIDFDWKEKGPAAPLPKDEFSVRWIGHIEAPATGDFTIFLTADEGARLWIGDTLMIDQWGSTARSEKSAVVKFTAGKKQPIRLEVCDHTGPAAVRLEWAGRSMARQVIPHTALSTFSTLYAKGQGLLNVGTQKQFPKPQQLGTPIQFELWQWGDKASMKKLMDLKHGAKVPVEPLPQNIQFQVRAPVDHDQVSFYAASSDSFADRQWGPSKPKSEKEPAENLYKLSGYGNPAQVGKYCLSFKAEKDGKVVAQSIIHFEIVKAAPIPFNTTITAGKKDHKGVPITYSKPVVLNRLNETAKLIDNDYAFEPQHAHNTINWERFPPFRMAPRFIVAYSSRRFYEEHQMGGPLDRGFNIQAVVKSELDNLPIAERAWWHTPDQQGEFIREWNKKEPGKFPDLKGYDEQRSPFVYAENAYYLGWKCYESWGAGGYGPYDAGLYGWDEELMGSGLIDKYLREHPDLLPPDLLALKDKALAGDKHALSVLHNAYIVAQGEFVGQTYRGARDNAAQRNRVFKIWHYGTSCVSNMLFIGREDALPDKTTGNLKYEMPDILSPYFKDKRGKLDFESTEFSRQIDYFHHDFYFHTIFPHAASMYEKDKSGAYHLDEKGRRKIRQDVIEETVYADPVKIGHQDFETSPMFLRAFIAKGENNMFWLNGGKYYKKRGTMVTDKQFLPALRPRNQETWGDTGKFLQRTINPYLAEASAILTFMIGCEGFYYWDQNLMLTPIGSALERYDDASIKSCGDIEFVTKGMHRVSQLNQLFEGSYQFVRPARHYNTFDRDHPIIRGILNGPYLALAMTNTYLDPTETQEVEVWYDAPYEKRATAKWSDKVLLHARKTDLFQCKLPALPAGMEYDPDKLYFRYVTKDGKYTATYTMSGNYDVPYPHGAAQ